MQEALYAWLLVQHRVPGTQRTRVGAADPESVHELATLLDSHPSSVMLGGVCCPKEERMRIAVALVAVVMACGTAALHAQDTASTVRARQLLRACEAGPGPADPLTALKAECRSACNRYLEQIGKLDSRLLGPFLGNCEDKHAALGEYQKGELYREGYHFSSLVPPQPLKIPAGSHQVVLFTSLACPGCMAERTQLTEWSASPWARSKSVIAVVQPLTGGFSPSSGFDYDAYALVDIAGEDLPPALATKVRNMAAETRLTMPCCSGPALSRHRSRSSWVRSPFNRGCARRNWRHSRAGSCRLVPMSSMESTWCRPLRRTAPR
jgi:hypothetical protein